MSTCCSLVVRPIPAAMTFMTNTTLLHHSCVPAGGGPPGCSGFPQEAAGGLNTADWRIYTEIRGSITNQNSGTTVLLDRQVLMNIDEHFGLQNSDESPGQGQGLRVVKRQGLRMVKDGDSR